MCLFFQMRPVYVWVYLLIYDIFMLFTYSAYTKALPLYAIFLGPEYWVVNQINKTACIQEKKIRYYQLVTNAECWKWIRKVAGECEEISILDKVTRESVNKKVSCEWRSRVEVVSVTWKSQWENIPKAELKAKAMTWDGSMLDLNSNNKKTDKVVTEWI